MSISTGHLAGPDYWLGYDMGQDGAQRGMSLDAMRAEVCDIRRNAAPDRGCAGGYVDGWHAYHTARRRNVQAQDAVEAWADGLDLDEVAGGDAQALVSAWAAIESAEECERVERETVRAGISSWPEAVGRSDLAVAEVVSRLWAAWEPTH